MHHNNQIETSNFVLKSNIDNHLYNHREYIVSSPIYFNVTVKNTGICWTIYLCRKGYEIITSVYLFTWENNSQEAQLMLTTGSTRLAVVEVNKHGTIPHVTYSFLLCNSNFVFKTRRFYDICLQKITWPWNGVKGHSRSLRVVSFDRLCMVSY